MEENYQKYLLKDNQAGHLGIHDSFILYILLLFFHISYFNDLTISGRIQINYMIS